MMPINKERIAKGRKAVNTYRDDHALLYTTSGINIIKEHRPLLETMLAEFVKRGFSSLKEFWGASNLLNITELGFVDEVDFEANATEADIEALDGMWR